MLNEKAIKKLKSHKKAIKETRAVVSKG